MEAIETVSSEKPRRKTPPSETDRKKQLIRELGRKPSEEKVSLYVRKPSLAAATVEQDEKATNGTAGSNKSKRFMDKMAKKSVETDFLNTIVEEEKEKKPFQRKYPFNR